jgi:two-component system, cell cycle response regulator DivK
MDADEDQKRTVLVVDDFFDSRLLIKTMLEMAGYRVVEAADGCEAIKVAQRERPDLILMDLSLPILDGISSTRAIRDLQPVIGAPPIIAFTAHSRDSLEQSARQAGCNDYLTKPVDFGRLKKLLADYAPLA